MSTHNIEFYRVQSGVAVVGIHNPFHIELSKLVLRYTMNTLKLKVWIVILTIILPGIGHAFCEQKNIGLDSFTLQLIFNSSGSAALRAQRGTAGHRS